jgi:hypothetical protein
VAHDDRLGFSVREDLLSSALPKGIKPLEAVEGRSEVDDRVVRNRPGSALVVAPRRPGPCTLDQVGLVAEKVDVPEEPLGEQPPNGRMRPLGIVPTMKVSAVNTRPSL